MAKKVIFTTIVTLVLILSFTYTFANNGLEDIANGARNVVGGAENAVEGAAKGVSNTAKNITGATENTAGNLGNDAKNTAGNVGNFLTNDNMNSRTTINNGDYTATRTATTDGTFMGMNDTAWTWLILGIAALAIVALVWYYSMQVTGNNYTTRNDEEE